MERNYIQEPLIMVLQDTACLIKNYFWFIAHFIFFSYGCNKGRVR